MVPHNKPSGFRSFDRWVKGLPSRSGPAAVGLAPAGSPGPVGVRVLTSVPESYFHIRLAARPRSALAPYFPSAPRAPACCYGPDGRMTVDVRIPAPYSPGATSVSRYRAQS